MGVAEEKLSPTKRKTKERDGNCCLVCGSKQKLEVDHLKNEHPQESQNPKATV